MYDKIWAVHSFLMPDGYNLYLMEMYFQRNMNTTIRRTEGEFFKSVYISYLKANVSILHLKISFFEEYKTFFSIILG